MSSPIRWVLFDADGVLQTMPPNWLAALRTALGDPPDAVLADLFDRERGTMTGGDFRAVVIDVLAEHGIAANPDQVLRSWQSVQVDPAMVARIAELRSNGIGCALATNQQNVRVAHLRALPDYVGVFDEQFYSSEIGVAKPNPRYFTTMVDKLGVDPSSALFIDDREDNVTGARVAGLQAEVFAQDAGVAELDRILSLYRLRP